MKKILIVCVVLCIISSGFAQNRYYSPYYENDYSWEWQPKDYIQNSWSKKLKHDSDSEETELYHSRNNDGEYEYYDSINHRQDDYNHGHHRRQEKGCVTPNGEKARCIPLNKCPVLKTYFYHHQHRSRFFKESICEHTYSEPLVCCGTEYNYKNQKVSTNLPPFSRVSYNFHSLSSRLPQPTLPVTITPTTSPSITTSETIVTPTRTIGTQESTKILNVITTLPSSKVPTITQTINVEENSTSIPFTTRPGSNLRSHRNFILLPSRNTCGLQGLDDRLFGGNETALSEFPWMVLLEYHLNGISTGYKCGGMLINNRYILTAAHCVFGKALPRGQNLLRVRLGEHNLNTNTDCRMDENNIPDCNQPPQDIGIEEIIVHPGFNDSDFDMLNDIALLRLRQVPMQNDFVRPICLPTGGERANPGENLTISGWGLTETESTSEIKLKAPVPYIEDSQCKRIWANARQISDNQFCAGGSGRVGACTGDSGGPIMFLAPGSINWYAEGIVSFGRLPCGIFPNVFTRISSYINWILDSIKP